MEKVSACWPIDPESNGRPEDFNGWPDRKRFALVLTHDVDTEAGQKRCVQLMQLEERLGFRSSFNFVPERYRVSHSLRVELRRLGFEVGVHGLKHDGKLFQSKRIFQKRSVNINLYLKQWNAVGFRAPAMHHNLDWIRSLRIAYDASTFDTDPFEPQSSGCKKIFPFWVEGPSRDRGFVELPYTLPQDFTVFVLMREYDLGVWRKKLDWLVQKGAMVLLNTHPDYMSFDGQPPGCEQYSARLYEEFLGYTKRRYHGCYWHALPMDVAKFWREHYSACGSDREAL